MNNVSFRSFLCAKENGHIKSFFASFCAREESKIKSSAPFVSVQKCDIDI